MEWVVGFVVILGWGLYRVTRPKAKFKTLSIPCPKRKNNYGLINLAASVKRQQVK